MKKKTLATIVSVALSTAPMTATAMKPAKAWVPSKSSSKVGKVKARKYTTKDGKKVMLAPDGNRYLLDDSGKHYMVDQAGNKIKLDAAGKIIRMGGSGIQKRIGPGPVA
ncbi:MAG: hypothetical protein P8Y63_00865 [Deltaproteobacteria bacterium]|jgi:hypothetical protein